VVYRFIDQYKDTFGLRWLLRQFNISISSYYNYKKLRKAAYHNQKQLAYDEIKRIYNDCNGIIGYRTMRIFLARKGIVLSEKTVHKYMNKDLKLYAITGKTGGLRTTDTNAKIFPNLVHRRFHVSCKNIIWCTDFTYIPLSNGCKRYNCTIIDLYDRSVVASINSKYLNTDLAIRTVTAALNKEKPASGLILHTDRGSQFTSLAFRDFCKEHHIIQSMSKAGCPYDNAPMERFYHTFKSELIKPTIFTSEADLDERTTEYIFLWYNKLRPHSYNKHLTPFQARYNLQPQYNCAKLTTD